MLLQIDFGLGIESKNPKLRDSTVNAPDWENYITIYIVPQKRNLVSTFSFYLAQSPVQMLGIVMTYPV